MAQTQFTWKPIFTEMAHAILQYRARQSELIQVLLDLQSSSLPVGGIQDQMKKGVQTLMKEIDPFTFFTAFNRKTTNQNRMKILERLKQFFKLSSPMPVDFDGVPLANAQNSWFFPYGYKRDEGTIDTLWDFAEALMNNAPSSVPPELFEQCLAINGIAAAKLTMGMFWFQPDQYLAMDARNRSLLAQLGIGSDNTEPETWFEYRTLIDEVHAALPTGSFCEFSYRAFLGQDALGYWIFQSNPAKYDLVGALKAGALRQWSVNQHVAEIKKGDRVVLWQTGTEGGVCAFATVNGEVAKRLDHADEIPFYIDGAPSSDPHSCVELNIDRIVVDQPITAAQITAHPPLSGLHLNLQGTNFRLTAEQFEEIESLLVADDPDDDGAVRYWLYAPGINANNWEADQSRQEMRIAFPGVGDLSEFNSKKEIADALGPTSKGNVRFNATLALWEFCKVLKEGDIVIAKKGNTHYIGYGFVSGPYVFEPNVEFCHSRKVRWVRSGSWPADPTDKANAGAKIVIKTLTDITKYPTYVKNLRKMFGVDDEWQIVRTVPTAELPSLNIILHGPPGTGKTHQLITKYAKLFGTGSLTNNDRCVFVTFHQSFSYEDFVEGIRPVVSEGARGGLTYTVQDGVFKQIASRAVGDPRNKYAIFIDEINRGNIASIFGELITLIEDDKRHDGTNGLSVTLPYSRDRFAVPQNLFIICTMNTADRSIEALDTALRRRFSFIELAPDPSLLSENVEGINLVLLLTTINRRIECLLDRDHCIGHSFLMGIASIDELRSAFQNKIMPLLREYFFNNAAKVGMVVGKAFVRTNNGGGVGSSRFAAGVWGDGDVESKDLFDFVDVSKVDAEGFTAIYGGEH